MRVLHIGTTRGVAELLPFSDSRVCAWYLSGSNWRFPDDKQGGCPLGVCDHGPVLCGVPFQGFPIFLWVVHPFLADLWAFSTGTSLVNSSWECSVPATPCLPAPLPSVPLLGS